MPVNAATAIPPLRRRTRSVSAEVAAHVERLIATGELSPGDRLPSERDLALSMSVSRASLREAMHELESKHLIERTPGRGTIVSAPPAEVSELLAIPTGPGDVEHAAELRSIIEPSLAGLAAHRATAANIVQLQDVIAQSTDSLRPSESLRLDIEFHLLLAQAAQNPLLATLQSLAGEWTGGVRKHSHSTKEGRRMSIRGHQAILDAIVAHDSAAARRAMEEHLQEVRRLIERATKR